MSELQKPPTLKVHYFDIRGQCQPIRNLLYQMGVEFQDIAHQKSTENSMDASFNLGFPMIQDGELRVHDSVAIINYLCRKYNRLDLLGLTPQSFAKMQEATIRYSLQKKKIIGSLCEMINYLSVNNEVERTKLIRERLRIMVKQCKFVDYCLKRTSQTKSFVCGKLSLVDFFYYEICFYFHGFFYEELRKHKFYKHFLEFKQNFEKLAFFKQNAAKFEERYIFFEFDDLEMNKKIEKYWKGRSKCLKQTTRQL